MNSFKTAEIEAVEEGETEEVLDLGEE
jgi:hypothetical protein